MLFCVTMFLIIFIIHSFVRAYSTLIHLNIVNIFNFFLTSQNYILNVLIYLLQLIIFYCKLHIKKIYLYIKILLKNIL